MVWFKNAIKRFLQSFSDKRQKEINERLKFLLREKEIIELYKK